MTDSQSPHPRMLHTCMHPHTHAHPHTRGHTPTCTPTHPPTHTHTHTHTRARAQHHDCVDHKPISFVFFTLSRVFSSSSHCLMCTRAQHHDRVDRPLHDRGQADLVGPCVRGAEVNHQDARGGDHVRGAAGVAASRQLLGSFRAESTVWRVWTGGCGVGRVWGGGHEDARGERRSRLRRCRCEECEECGQAGVGCEGCGQAGVGWEGCEGARGGDHV
jgi:hypothetical protein